MRKRIGYLLLIIILVTIFSFGFTACNNLISFSTNFVIDGEIVHTITTKGNEKIKLPDVPIKEGYIFDGWYTDDAYENVYKLTTLPEENITLYGKWIAKNYQINYNLNGGINNNDNPAIYNIETKTFSILNPTREGYTFEGWYTDTELIIPAITNIKKGSKGDLIFYAKWRGSQNITNNGKLYNTPEGLTVLDMNGTEYEMGYAHGFLLGYKIKYMVEYCFWLTESYDYYSTLHDEVLPLYLLKDNNNYYDELEGILKGAIASEADIYVESLERNWDIIDLLMINTIPDWYGTACSGVGIWGASSVDNQTLIGRNLDFFMDSKGYLSQLYTMMIFRGNAYSNRYDIISFAFPGYIGILTGFNTEGVWVQLNVSNGGIFNKKERNGISFANRRFLETHNGTDIENLSQSFYLEQNLFNSMLLMIGSNNSETDNSSPVFVLEVRDDIVGFRGEANPLDDYVILTNHERVNQDAINCDRYSRYINDLNEYKSTQDNKIDSDELLISQRNCGFGTTVNAIQFYPSTLIFRIGFARITNNDEQEDNALIGGPWDSLLNTWYSWEMFK